MRLLALEIVENCLALLGRSESGSEATWNSTYAFRNRHTLDSGLFCTRATNLLIIRRSISRQSKYFAGPIPFCGVKLRPPLATWSLGAEILLGNFIQIYWLY